MHCSKDIKQRQIAIRIFTFCKGLRLGTGCPACYKGDELEQTVWCGFQWGFWCGFRCGKKNIILSIILSIILLLL